MSAITGIFYRDGRKVDPDQMKKMNDRLSHRGKDGSAIWCQGSVGLGHQMLWTTPESLHEKLPFHDEKAGLVITADARIDNRKELSQELSIEDKEDVSDSYFILKSYEKWGEKCPEYLLGDFAFAIWDENEEKLFCARDHMGVKPFYYYLDDEMFVFGTEIKALFCVLEIPKKLNEIKIADYLLYMFNDKEITFYEDIYRIPNAYYMTIHSNKTILNRYWELDINKEIKFNSNEEYAAKFKEIFFEAVKCRLRSYSQIGSLLSGGLDSSSIVCTASEINKGKENNIVTFSAVFDEVPQCDERQYINEVLSKTSVESHFIYADQFSPLCNYKEFFWHFDQPFYAPNLFMHWKLFEKAHEKGINVILDGFDGDTTILKNNNYIVDLAINMHFQTLYNELKVLSKYSNKNLITLFTERIIGPLVPEFIKENLLSKQNSLFSKWNRNNKYEFLNNEFLENFAIIERYHARYEDKLKKANNYKKYHNFRLNSGSFQFILELVDSVSAAFNIEPRYPFFDKRLLEFCLALPDNQKHHLNWDRIILRESMDNILPSNIRWRLKKSNLGPNFERGLLLFEKNRILNLINDNELVRNYADLNYLKETIEYINTNNFDHVSLINIWKILTLNLWLKETKIIFKNKKSNLL
ncbi:MAG: asparagine synthase (glutamine-hydrolyzing) [Methanobacterium sp. BRmetb2]|nr:MAG: asparagine synthase (glutamine-hydrolyzing) [Methanobacterium sp. BRmetb2]